MSEIVQRPPHEPLVPPGGMELHARDMTATFSADCPLRFVQWKLAEIGQWLPIDGSPDATLGQLVETNSTGPLRLGFGAWRDLLLGVQFTNGMGELITAGGRTVKNVAGYDLTKFMVGGQGIFGRLVSITTRTYGMPEGALLVRREQVVPDPASTDAQDVPTFVRTLERFAGEAAALLPTPLRPQWALLTPDALLCGYLGDDRTLAWYEANVQSTGPVEANRRTVQDDIEHRARLWRVGDEAGERDGLIAFRASVPPARLGELVARLNSLRWVADPAFGIVIGSVLSDDARTDLRADVAAVGGNIRFGASAASLDISTNPAERQIIERLKTAFDPDHRLNPLPWQRR